MNLQTTKTNYSFRALLAALAALALTTSLVAALVKPAEAAFPGKNGKIVFSSNRTNGGENPEKDFEIFMVNRDGSGLEQLTDNVSNDSHPAVSADGQRIAFSRNLGGSYETEIYTMEADGSDQERIILSGGRDENPAWSPDGTWILFETDRENGEMEIYAMGANGGSPNNMSHNNDAADIHPAWSPDGSKIAFTSCPNNNCDVYTMPAHVYNGTNQIRLTHASAQDHTPNWSPFGAKIAFTSYRDGNYEIYTMNADGSTEVNRSNHPAQDLWPAFSPNGRRIAFMSTRYANAQSIYTMKANGEDPVGASTSYGNNYSPDWQPLPG